MTPARRQGSLTVGVESRSDVAGAVVGDAGGGSHVLLEALSTARTDRRYRFMIGRRRQSRSAVDGDTDLDCTAGDEGAVAVGDVADESGVDWHDPGLCARLLAAPQPDSSFFSLETSVLTLLLLLFVALMLLLAVASRSSRRAFRAQASCPTAEFSSPLLAVPAESNRRLRP